MLNEELRVKTGLTYGARNVIDTNRLEGMNAIATFTKTESTVRALDLSVATLNELRTETITAAQLASAKAYLKGTLPRQLIETGDQLARQLIRLDVLGLGREEIDALFERIDAVTTQQANTVAQKYFGTAGLTFVLVGDASKIKDKLTQVLAADTASIHCHAGIWTIVSPRCRYSQIFSSGTPRLHKSQLAELR